MTFPLRSEHPQAVARRWSRMKQFGVGFDPPSPVADEFRDRLRILHQSGLRIRERVTRGWEIAEALGIRPEVEAFVRSRPRVKGFDSPEGQL